MRQLLIDTNVLANIMRRTPDGARYQQFVQANVGHISFVTVAELRFGAERDMWGMRRRMALEELLKSFVQLPNNDEITKIVAKLAARRQRAGRRIEWRDAWVAATALWYQLPLLTDDAEFEGIEGLETVKLP